MKQSIRVGHLVDLSMVGGVEVMFSDYLAAEMRLGREDCHRVIALGEPNVLVPPNVNLVTVSSSGRVRRCFALATMIRQLKPDLLYGHGYAGAIWCFLIGRLLRLPYVVHEHGTAWNVRGIRLRLVRLVYSRAAKVLCNSAAALVVLQKHVKVRASVPIVVVHNGIDFRRLGSGVSEIGEFRGAAGLVYVGSLKRMKGAYLLPALLERIVHRLGDTTLRIVGDGPLRKSIEAEMVSRGLGQFVEFTGVQKHVGEYIRRANVLISLSVREPFGNVLVEAGALGIPVVAPFVDGIPEAVSDGETGLLVRPSCLLQRDVTGLVPRWVFDPDTGSLVPPREVDLDDFAEKVVCLMKSEQLRKSLGGKAAVRCKEMNSIDLFANRIHDILVSTAHDRRILGAR